jgi:hypothetical protein
MAFGDPDSRVSYPMSPWMAANGDFAAALAFLDDRLSKLEEEEDLPQEPAPEQTAPADADCARQRLEEILRQAASVDQAIHEPGQGSNDDEIDLENLDLEWRFSAPSTRR